MNEVQRKARSEQNVQTRDLRQSKRGEQRAKKQSEHDRPSEHYRPMNTTV